MRGRDGLREDEVRVSVGEKLQNKIRIILSNHKHKPHTVISDCCNGVGLFPIH